MTDETTQNPGTTDEAAQGQGDQDQAGAAAGPAAQPGADGAPPSDPATTVADPGADQAAADQAAAAKKGGAKSKAGAAAGPAAQPGAESPDAKASGPKVMKIKNKAYAGMSVYGLSGKPAVFNAEGVAEVGADDHAYFLNVPGYEEA